MSAQLQVAYAGAKIDGECVIARHRSAARVIWEFVEGRRRTRFRHTCGKPRCANPFHLRPA